MMWCNAPSSSLLSALAAQAALRATAATFALRAGITTFELSRYMGASLTMIDRHYGHLAKDGRQHAMNLLDTYTARRPPRGRSVDAQHTPAAARINNHRC
jgi:hypothetical protein